MKRFLLLTALLSVSLLIPLAASAQTPAGDGAAAATPTLPPGDTGAAPAGAADALSSALGTLAVYAAIIAALAAGTEVISDLLRPFFGLERQPQAIETFERMKEWLPQTLKEMGADPQAQARLQGYLADLGSTVTEFEGYATGHKISATVQKWALTAIKGGQEQLEARLKELEAELKKDSGLPEDQITAIKDRAREGAVAILAAVESGQAMLQKLRDLLAGLNLQAAQIDSAVGRALELANTLVEDEQLRRELKTLLAGLGVPDGEVDGTARQAGELLQAIKRAPGAQEVVKLATSLDSYGRLLDSVEGQRGEMISCLRKWWRALRNWRGLGLTRYLKTLPEWISARSLPGVLLYALEAGWNWLRGHLAGGVEEGIEVLLTPENAAQVILDLDRQHYLTEVRRQRLLRAVTVVIGVALAVIVRVDSLDLLRPLFVSLPEALFDGEGHALTLASILEKQLGWVVTGWWGSVRWLFTWMEAATPGMLLSGLAASAGSSFWHDQLDRLRAAKKTTEQVQAVVSQVQAASGNQA